MNDVKTDEYLDTSRWFDSLGPCGVCGKPAHGIVRGMQNESMGRYCTKCGEKRVKDAAAARAKVQKVLENSRV